MKNETRKHSHTFRSFCRLLKSIYTHDKEIDEKILHILRTRAWIFFTAQTILRLSEIATVSPGWFEDTTFCDDLIKTRCVGEYNEAFLDPGRPIMGIALLVITIL